MGFFSIFLTIKSVRFLLVQFSSISKSTELLIYLRFLYAIIMKEKNSDIYFIGNGILLLVKVAWFQSIDIFVTNNILVQ